MRISMPRRAAIALTCCLLLFTSALSRDHCLAAVVSPYLPPLTWDCLVASPPEHGIVLIYAEEEAKATVPTDVLLLRMLKYEPPPIFNLLASNVLQEVLWSELFRFIDFQSRDNETSPSCEAMPWLIVYGRGAVRAISIFRFLGVPCSGILNVTDTTPPALFGPDPAIAIAFRECGELKHAKMRKEGVGDIGVTTEDDILDLRSFWMRSSLARPRMFMGIEEVVWLVKSRIEDPSSDSNNPLGVRPTLLVDTRTVSEFLGATTGYDFVDQSGRIPTSVHVDSFPDRLSAWNMLPSVESFDESMRSVLSSLAEDDDVDLARAKRNIELVLFCGTGWRAGGMWDVARVAGWERIRVFDGGWNEWVMDSTNPIALGPDTVCFETF